MAQMIVVTSSGWMIATRPRSSAAALEHDAGDLRHEAEQPHAAAEQAKESPGPPASTPRARRPAATASPRARRRSRPGLREVLLAHPQAETIGQRVTGVTRASLVSRSPKTTVEKNRRRWCPVSHSRRRPSTPPRGAGDHVDADGEPDEQAADEEVEERRAKSSAGAETGDADRCPGDDRDREPLHAADAEQGAEGEGGPGRRPRSRPRSALVREGRPRRPPSPALRPGDREEEDAERQLQGGRELLVLLRSAVAAEPTK